jgi:hypothetical protein
MNNASQGLNLIDYTASGINTEDELYKVIFSDDEGNGAAAIELDTVLDFINYYTKTDDVRNHKGYTLEMIIKEFTGFRRMLYEPDSVYLRRFLAITERKKDEVWGTKWNIQHVFEAYFNWVKIYMSEYTNDITKNLLLNGDFEDVDDTWETGGEAEYTGDARFSGKRGLFFTGMPGTCKQGISDLQEGVYTLHFFIKGKCGVKIRNSHGRYWNATARPNNYILKWQDGTFINEFSGDAWQDVFCFIVLPETMGIAIEFVSLENENCCIDYARLFKKPLNPTYTVIVQYEGYQITDKTLHLAKGKDEPIDGVDYSKESYFDHHYIVGRLGTHRREVFNSLLEIIRPLGIQPFLEFIEKEYVDEQVSP